MNLSRRQLYAMGEPFGESATREEAGRRICGGGGGGGSSSTTTPMIAPELQPLARLYTQQATQLAATPWQSYGGQRFADMNATQNLGVGMIQDRALNGDSTVNAGRNYLEASLRSGPTGATVNPVGGVEAGTNTSTVSAGANPYARQTNPYLDQMVQKAQDSVKSNFNTSAVNSGSFGNSGLQQQYAAGLTDVATQMYGNAYNTQAQLAESDLNRSLSAQQFNSGIVDSNLARSMAAQQFNSQLGNDWASRNDSAFQNWRGNQLNAAQLGLNYGNQAYQDAGQLLNAGNLQQQQQQQKLDFGYQQFQDAQNNPYKKLQTIGGVVGQAQGSTTTSSGGGK